MKKTILTLVTLAVMTTSFQANALIAGGMALVGTGGAGAIAIIGLGLGIGGQIIAGGLAAPVTGFLGGLLLDGENGQEIQFKKVAHDDLLKMNLTEDEARAFNDNTDELAVAFKMVTNELTKDSKVEDAKKLWEEQEAILGSDAINGARKVLANALKK